MKAAQTQSQRTLILKRLFPVMATTAAVNISTAVRIPLLRTLILWQPWMTAPANISGVVQILMQPTTAMNVLQMTEPVTVSIRLMLQLILLTRQLT